MHPPGDTITDFLTDGSLAALCMALSRLTGVKVSLIDASGRSIIVGDDDQPWHVSPAGPRSPVLAKLLADSGSVPVPLVADEEPGTNGAMLMPLHVAGKPIGAFLIEPPSTGQFGVPGAGGSPDSRALLDFCFEMLASTVSEFCEQAVEINQRHSELRLLFRLSSLLVATRDVSAILHVALRSAIEIFSLDAGSVHLLASDEKTLELSAQVGLAKSAADRIATLPADNADIRTSVVDRHRETIANATLEAGLPGMVSVGLFFKEKPMGVLRLYGRRAELLGPTQTELLQTIAEQVAAAVAGARLIESERDSARIRRQLELAGDVQRRMLPQKSPDFPALDIAARYIPSFELGGDFYDLITLNGHIGVAVGDVSGKGVPAALLMAAVRASLRAHASDLYHINDVLTRVNRAMARDTLPNEFATVFYGVIDPKSMRLTYCNAGHDPPMIIQLSSGKPPSPEIMHDLTTGGMIIGVDPTARFDRGMFDLKPGDLFVAYTDGLIDAMNFEGKKYGRPRMRESLLEFLRGHPGASAKMIADHLVWEVRRFIGLNEPTDDTTLVVIRAQKV